MKLTHDNGEVLLTFEYFNLVEVNRDLEIEKFIEKRREALWTNVDRKYLHLVEETDKWLVISNYNKAVDRDGKYLDLLINNRNKFVLIKSEVDMTKFKLGELQFIRPYKDLDVYMVMNKSTVSVNDISSKEIYGYLAVDYAVDTDIDNNITTGIDNIMALIKKGWYVISPEVKLRLEDTQQYYLMRNKGDIYVVPTEISYKDTESKDYIIKIIKMKERTLLLDSNVFKVGDLVKINGESPTYIVIKANYNGTLEDTTQSTYEIKDVKTGSSLTVAGCDITLL